MIPRRFQDELGWSIPDRKIALKYLLAVKQGMEPRQWAQLHPEDWKRLVLGAIGLLPEAHHEHGTLLPMTLTTAGVIFIYVVTQAVH